MRAAVHAEQFAIKQPANLCALLFVIANGVSDETGTAFAVEPVFNIDQVRVLRGSVALYRQISDESGRWLLTEFCANCGANIGFTLEAVPGIRTIAAGTFDNPEWISSQKQLFRHVFVRSARDWSEIPKDVEQYEMHFRPQ